LVVIFQPGTEFVLYVILESDHRIAGTKYIYGHILYKTHTRSFVNMFKNKWEDDDPELWEASSKAFEEDMEVNAVAVPAPPSPLPTGNNQRILAHLAKRRSLKIKDVPGDGDCFFHTVSHSLSSRPSLDLIYGKSLSSVSCRKDSMTCTLTA